MEKLTRLSFLTSIGYEPKRVLHVESRGELTSIWFKMEVALLYQTLVMRTSHQPISDQSEEKHLASREVDKKYLGLNQTSMQKNKKNSAQSTIYC